MIITPTLFMNYCYYYHQRNDYLYNYYIFFVKIGRQPHNASDVFSSMQFSYCVVFTSPCPLVLKLKLSSSQTNLKRTVCPAILRTHGERSGCLFQRNYDEVD